MTPRPPKQAYIGKNTDDDRLFNALKQEGIGYIEDLCGKVWTDYNLHDPGITILEQCCYAMTEMAYRAGFDVADILTDESGRIDYAAQALFPPHEIFTNQALTPREYENLIFDSVRGVDNVWVEPVRKGPVSGLYRIRYRVRDRIAPSEAEDILRQVLDVFCRNRSLCEDVEEIHQVKNQYLSLLADVEIDGSHDPALTLALIYRRCADRVSPGISYAPWEDLEGKSPEEIFTGPLMSHGFIDHAPKPRQPGYLNIQALAGEIRSVPGVLGVTRLALEEEGTHLRHCDLISLDNPDLALSLRIPDKTSRIRVKLFKKKRWFEVGMEELDRQLQALRKNPSKLGLSLAEMEKVRNLPKGRFRELGSYHSIMDQFPNAYGINEFGIPPSFPADERARAKQLKAFLLFFEQPMINFMATLKNIPRLFSLDATLNQSNFSSLLDDSHAPDIEHLYAGGKEACRLAQDGVRKKYDRFFDRRNRVLDYLLSLYGERFRQNALRRFNYYFSETGLSLWLIRIKLRFLKHLPRLSSARASGFNYLLPSWNTENVDGLKLKASLLLGFRYHEGRSLTIAFTKHGLELIADEDLADLKKGTVEIQYVDPSDIQGKMQTPFKKIGFSRLSHKLTPRDIRRLFTRIVFLQNNLLNESFLVNGLAFKNYRIGRFTDRSWQLIFKPHDKARWCYLGAFGSLGEALRAANHLRYFIKTLNIMSEGLHIVDHVLLRPSATSSFFSGLPHDFFDFRISLIFPAWPARCANEDFRKLAEETVRINAPAHVRMDVYWLGFQDMLSFEILFHDWLACKASGEGPKTDRRAAALIEFLMDHDKDKSRMIFL